MGAAVGGVVGNTLGQQGSAQHSTGHGNPILSRGPGHGIGSKEGPGVVSPGQLHATGQFAMRSNCFSAVRSVTSSKSGSSHDVIPNGISGPMICPTEAQPPVMLPVVTNWLLNVMVYSGSSMHPDASPYPGRYWRLGDTDTRPTACASAIMTTLVAAGRCGLVVGAVITWTAAAMPNT